MKNNLTLDWHFPLSRTHCGILLGNGLFGAVVWGDKRLCITLNRADFWDHRGNRPITEKTNYANLRRIWEAGDEEAMQVLVRRNLLPESGRPKAPSGLPMGRIELDFGPEARVGSASLRMYEGSLHVQIEVANRLYIVKFFIPPDKPVLLIELEKGLEVKEIVRRPSWEFVGDYLKSISFIPPQMLDEPDLTGWIQMRPADPYMCLGCGKVSGGLIIASVYGNSTTVARTNAVSLINSIKEETVTEIYRKSRTWWNKYWDNIPEINLPSKKAEEIYYYGMFKFAGLTNPHGMAALLQGPWVEEYRMPMCSNDYHFNINVQMCYWPAYAGNCLEHFKPLFKKLKEWEPIMRRNAEALFGVKDGLYLPMTVSDTGEWIWGFWPSLVDFAATGWAAHLMWLYYKYSMDIDFLRDTAYPFMKGIMRVYEAVLEEENGHMVLPLSTSPEYNESTLKTGGKNPSFQLACIHFLLESLIESALLFGIDNDKIAIWRSLKKKIPLYTTIDGGTYFNESRRRIAVFEGQDLEWSHRHHSHLACIHPFDTVDREDKNSMQVLNATINQWINKGVGWWLSFSFVWASVIHSRLGNGEAAHLFLDLWQRLFTNEGRGTMVYGNSRGLVSWAYRPTDEMAFMLLDSDMGAVNAVQEMLMHTVRGRLTVFPAVPQAWQNISFKNMRAEGAFLVSAERKEGKITGVRIISEAGQKLRLQNNIAPEVLVIRNSKKKIKLDSKVMVLETEKGDVLEIKP